MEEKFIKWVKTGAGGSGECVEQILEQRSEVQVLVRAQRTSWGKLRNSIDQTDVWAETILEVIKLTGFLCLFLRQWGKSPQLPNTGVGWSGESGRGWK